MDSKTPSNYQVIARKYRPQTLSTVVGQEAIVTTLKNALRYNRLAHAYLFCGCRGTGKTTLARVFAKALNCSALSAEFEPCNACSSCLDINAGRSLDVLEIDGASNRGIDDIRQINETIGYAPASGKYKIYIIDEVHMLTKEAFNALLKTLEEPPPNVKFFFATTEPHKVLPTIISRCQRFDLNRIPFEALKKKLAWIAADLNVPCEEEVFSLIANLSEGSLRDAESLFDQIICYSEHPITVAKVSATLGLMPRSSFFALDAAFNEQNLSFAFELAGDIFSSGKDLSYFLDNLIEHYRSLLKLKIGGPVPFPTTRLKEQYTASSASYTEEQCLYILDFLIHWQQQIGKTPFKRVSLEMILLHIIRSKHRIALPTLIKRLHELEQQAPSAARAPEIIPQAIEPVAVKEPEIILEAVAPVEPPAKAPEIVPQPAEPVAVKEPEVIPEAVAPAVIAPEAIPSTPSIEDALLKKIRDKIESTPAYVETPEVETEPSPVAEIMPKQPSLILSKSQWQAISGIKEIQETASLLPVEPVALPVKEEAAAPQNLKESLKLAETLPQSRYDTLMRFAAVELEGTLKKEQTNG